MIYPASVRCPLCGLIAANLTVPAPRLLEIVAHDPERINRHYLRTDAGKPGPSNHLVVCQHCHDAFRANPLLIINEQRTI